MQIYPFIYDHRTPAAYCVVLVGSYSDESRLRKGVCAETCVAGAKAVPSSAFTMCRRGWYLCMEFKMICSKQQEEISWLTHWLRNWAVNLWGVESHSSANEITNSICLTSLLTCPKGSRWLLVSLSFWKETSCLIQWAPEAGESGCT